MPRRRSLAPLLLGLAVAFGACAKKRPPLVVAMEPRPNPPLYRPPADTPRERLRQNRWLAQFWEELTPGQRRRVESRMRRSQPPIAADQESAGSAWDTLGLAERDRLVFGGAAPARRTAAAAATTADTAADGKTSSR
jgi:hypothetical protein